MKEKLKVWIEEQTEMYNDEIQDILEEGICCSENNKEYNFVMGKLQLLLELKKYLNYELTKNN
mgnify:FL=1|tara:strand:- start:16446 stop:16634 length:189 start_codon:yes stop_codon:yes gene_type:complete